MNSFHPEFCFSLGDLNKLLDSRKRMEFSRYNFAAASPRQREIDNKESITRAFAVTARNVIPGKLRFLKMI